MNEILTPLYKFIVLLEESCGVELCKIEFKQDRVTKGVIGKLDAMGYIDKSDGLIKLSSKGYVFLNSILSSIHRSIDHWDGKWRIVYFSTPESIRSKRDKFRRDIESLGFRAIIKGLWFSPMPILNKVSEAVKKNGIDGMVITGESGEMFGIEEEMVSRAWEFDHHRDQLENFIKLAQNALDTKNLNRLEIKELIFFFAIILNNEPIVPIELLPKDWPKYRAVLLYKRLKNLINI